MRFIDVNGDSVGVRVAGRTVYMHFQGKLVNDSSKNPMSEEELQVALEEMKAGYLQAFNQKQVGQYKLIATIDFTVASEDNPITSKDHVVHLSTQNNSPLFTSYGHTEFDKDQVTKRVDFQKAIYVAAEIRNNEAENQAGQSLTGNGIASLRRTFAHEVGHTAGIGLKSGNHLTKSNLMRPSEWGGGWSLNPQQIESMVWAFQTGRLNHSRQLAKRN